MSILRCPYCDCVHDSDHEVEWDDYDRAVCPRCGEPLEDNDQDPTP